MGSSSEKKLISPIGQNLKDKITAGRFNIILPEIFGFCGGVVHAVKMMEDVIDKNSSGRLFLLGEIIHNKNVNEYFRKKGVVIIDHEKLGSIFTLANENDTVIIPAFGIDLELELKIRAHFKSVIDTTCNDVKRVWEFISTNSTEGATILIYGHPFHPEVEASISRASKMSAVVVIPSMNSAENFISGKNDGKMYILRPEKLNRKNFALSNQTTMLYSETVRIRDYLKSEFEKQGATLSSCNSICKATYLRQSAALKILTENKLDLIFVVGGYDSSNTNNLYKLAESYNKLTFYISDASCIRECFTIEHYLPKEKITVSTDIGNLVAGMKNIGILAGASCPHSLVEELISKLMSLN